MLLSVCFRLQSSSQGNLLASYAGSMCAGDINIIFCSLLICEYCIVAVCWMERLDKKAFMIRKSMIGSCWMKNTKEGSKEGCFMIRKSVIGFVSIVW